VIPYFPEPVFRAGWITLHAFNVLLTAGVVAGGYIMVRRARRLGLSGHLMFAVCGWAFAFGLVGADVAKMLMDYHSLVAAHPALLFTTTRGLRSAGWLAGGLIGAVLCCLWKRLSFDQSFQLLDVMAFAMPFAILMGRLGCALVHDHRGVPTTAWIAVRFPEGPRFDLGLIEFLFMIPVSAAFLWLDRKSRRPGFYVALFTLVYGAFRVWLDTLHIQPMRFYEGIAGCIIGISAWMIMALTQATLDEANGVSAGLQRS
jgi:phosphatidylglycerol---prolipoprotein diacylglyceryl transferase